MIGELQARSGVEIREKVPLSACTSLRLGGPADYFAEPDSPEALTRLLSAARELGLPVTVIGRGSNLLVRDGGIRGLVIRIGRPMSALTRDGLTVTAGAGATLGELARFAAQHSLAGLAFAAGIPGSVGGGTVMNAGAYGGELGERIVRAEGVDLDGAPFDLTNAALGFGYRHSVLQDAVPPKIVTRVTFALQSGNQAEIEAEMAELGRRRAEKQPLNVPSAGSAFKRPAGYFAAALIDQCGLKGYAVGGASVSEKHAGFLISQGGTAADFERLMAEVAGRVEAETGVRLEPEIRVLGEP